MSTATMTPETTAPPDTPAQPDPQARRRFTADEYQPMGAAGIMADQERTELIDGEIYTMARIGSLHSAVVSASNKRFVLGVRDRAVVRVQAPIHLSDQTEPGPDVALVRPRADDYRGSHPVPAEVFLLVEVMDSSARHDRLVKLPRYALEGVAEVWLVDPPGGFLETCRNPVGDAYTEQRSYRHGDLVAAAAFPDLVLDTAIFLGRPEI